MVDFWGRNIPRRWDELTHGNKKLYALRQKIMSYAKKLASLTPWYDENFLKSFEKKLSHTFRDLLPAAGVLDVGCGPGDLSEIFCKQYGAQYYLGVDNSKGMVRDAKSDFPCSTFICADVGALPLADKSFDIVHSAYLIHHLKRVDRPRALREMMRVARRAVVVVECFGFPRGFWHLLYAAYYTLFDGSYYRCTLAEWRSLFDQAQGRIAKYFITDEKIIAHRLVCWLIVP